MSQVIRVKPPLTLRESEARLKHLHDVWRIRRWRVMRHAWVAPAPATDSACRLGLAVLTLRDLLEAYNRPGPDALATTGQGRRPHASLAGEAERTVLAPFLAARQAGHMAMGHTSKKAFADASGHRVATSTVSRLWHRPHWRTVGPRPNHPRRSPAAPAPLPKTSPS